MLGASARSVRPWLVLSALIAAAGACGPGPRRPDDEHDPADAGASDAAQDGAPLPAPGRGACAFLQPMAAVTTPNANCPMGEFQGDAIIREDADLSALAGCQRITGDLVVLSPTLSDLAALEALQVVDGNLLIYGRRDYRGAHAGSNQNLESLHGLEALRCVGRRLQVGQDNTCKALDIGALSSLVEVGGALSAHSWCSGSSFGSAFESLRRVWGDAEVAGPESLPALERVYGRSKIDPAVSTPKLSYVGCASDAAMCRDGILGCSLDVQQQSELAALKDCRIAVGDLTLSGDIDDLRPLSRLREVRGLLGIHATRDGLAEPSDKLTSLAGLEALETAHAIRIAGLSKLQSLASLAQLRALRSNRDIDTHTLVPELEPGDLTLSTLPALRDLSGLDALEQIQGTLFVDHCDLLSDLEALETTRVGGLVASDNGALRSPLGPNYDASVAQIDLMNLAQLTDVAGLTSIQDSGRVQILNCPKLANLDGFSGLEHAPSVSLDNNVSLKSLAGLSALQRAEIGIWLSGNALSSLEGLGALEQLGSLTVQETALTNLEGLGPVTAIDFVSLDACSALTDLRGLEQLQRAGTFELRGAAELTHLTGLEKLEEVGTFTLSNNPKLTSLEALQKLTKVSAFGFEALPMLGSLAGLQGLREVDSLSLSGLALQDLQGLSSLSKLGALVASDMPQLRALQGLTSLASQGMQELRLTDNPQLSDLRALAPVTSIDMLSITGQPALHDLDGLQGVTRVALQATLDGDFSLQPLRNLTEVGDLSVSGTASSSLGELVKVRKLGLFFIHGGASQPGSLPGPPALETVFELNISESTFSDLHGLSALRGTIDGLNIDSNSNLTSLDGLQGVEQITQLAYITNNPVLTSLSGLSQLQTASQVTVSGNPKLVDIDGLARLTEVTSLTLLDEPLLADYHSLANLKKAGQLHLGGSPLVTDLSDLQGLSSLEGLGLVKADGLKDLTGLTGLHGLIFLELVNNAQLESLNGLEGIATVESIRIQDNAVLHDLRGLRNATNPHTFNLTSTLTSVTNNPKLYQCEVAWLADHFHEPVPEGTNGPPGTCAP